MNEDTLEYSRELRPLSREFFDKYVGECTPGELRALMEIRDARRRLAKVDAFLGSLR